MKKKYIIILMCILSGFILLITDFYYEWSQFNLVTKNHISFIAWLMSNNGLGHIFDTLNDLGIGLIGSAIFLIMVDWTIANAERRIVDATELEDKRRKIAWEMRYAPQQALEMYRICENVSNLFTNQFFQGCKWYGLNLDGLNFSKSDLTNCDFSNSSLVDTNLSYCILSGAVFTDVKLTCTNFTGSNVSDEQLKVAYSLWQSIMPNGEKYDGRFMLKGDIKEASQYGYDIVNDDAAKNAYFNTKEINK